MTVEMEQTLEQFKQRFEDIKKTKLDDYIRSIRLSALLTDIETVFQLPTYGHERINAFRTAFPEVIEFYQEVNFSKGL